MVWEKLSITTNNNFDAYILLVDKEPSKIEIRKQNSYETVIEFSTDAVDCMGFCNIDERFEKLNQKDQQAAAACFAQVLQTCYGGKNFLVVKEKLSGIFCALGFNIFPKIPNDKPYERFMFVEKTTLLNELPGLAAAQSEKLARLDEKKYRIVSDKVILQHRTEEISRLFIENADYAGNETKRKSYSAPAILYRINNEHTHPFAIANSEGKTIGFMRVYIAHGIGAYVSDLVVDREYQKQGVAVWLMQKIFELLKDKVNTVFLIAGSDTEAKYYETKLGFKKLCYEGKPLKLGQEKVFMFKLIPQQLLLKEFLENFPMPSPLAALSEEKQQVSIAQLVQSNFLASISSTPKEPCAGKEPDVGNTLPSGMSK